jgi:SAM-dependent methyltransferase
VTRAPDEPIYDQIGVGYAKARRADPRVARAINDALGDAATVVNIGAGTGNYEPTDRLVVAVEPSRTMIEQRVTHAAPAVQAVAEHLPFSDDTFDAAMAALTLHHWQDVGVGLAEMRRVSRRQVIFLFDAQPVHSYWLVVDYFPGWAELPSEKRAPSVADVAGHLDVIDVVEVPVPADCTDGFGGAYWNRPEAHLDPEVLAGMSWSAQLPDVDRQRGIDALAADLASGAWDERHGHLRALDQLDLGYRLVVAG